MDNTEDYNPTYAEILHSLLILGMREAAYSLSIVVNKAIDIDEPNVTITTYDNSIKKYFSTEEQHRVTFLNYNLSIEDKTESGLFVFQFSQGSDDEAFNSILEKINDKSEAIKTSVVKEITNILGSSMVKILANKTDINMEVFPPKQLIDSGFNLVKEISKELKENKISSEQVIIFETAFLDLNKAVQLKMFFVPGETYQTLIGNLVQNRIN